MYSAHDPVPFALARARRRAQAAAVADAAGAAGTAAITTVAAVMLAGWNPVGPALVVVIVTVAWVWRSPPSRAGVAAALDDQFGLHDLLASAWAVRDRLDQPWAAALWSIANAKAATLPPSPWPGRFSPRQHACGLAMAVALVLTSVLISPATIDAAAARQRHSTASLPTTSILTIADVRHRAGDTAGSDTRPDNATAVDRQATAGRSDRRNESPAADDAQGTGRADADTRSELPPSVTASTHLMANGPAGSGMSSDNSTSVNKAPVGDVVPARAGRQPRAPSKGVDPKGTANGNTPAVQMPAAYRDLVREFFER